LLAASACLFALAGPVDQRQRAEERTRAAPDLDARFTSAKGWIGADGIYSVALPGNRTAWLFSDT